MRDRLRNRLVLIAVTLALGISALAQPQERHRADWMAKAKWGVMTHYLADWKSQDYNLQMSVEKWNSLIDNFDVEALANQLQSVGASYYMISIGQNSGYYLSPNATYDKLTGIRPSKLSHRDLIADLYTALHKRGIRLMVYLPSGAPNADKQADAALQWRNGPYPNKEFQKKWEQIIREWSERWGDKVSGWWFDGCFFPNSMYRSPQAPNFASFAAAARAGNPNSALAFNPSVIYRLISMTPYEDYIPGEIDNPELASARHEVDGRVDDTQIHMLSFLGEKWGRGNPRFTTEQAVAYTKKLTDIGGAVTWDVPIQLNGTISQPFLDQLSAIGKALNTE